MSSWHEFLTMGGYGAYVWPAYSVVLVVMIVNAILPSRRQRTLLNQLRRQQPSEGKSP